MTFIKNQVLIIWTFWLLTGLEKESTIQIRLQFIAIWTFIVPADPPAKVSNFYAFVHLSSRLNVAGTRTARCRPIGRQIARWCHGGIKLPRRPVYWTFWAPIHPGHQRRRVARLKRPDQNGINQIFYADILISSAEAQWSSASLRGGDHGSLRKPHFLQAFNQIRA